MSENIDTKEMDAEAKAAAANAAEYEHGWSSDIETEFAEKGLNEETGAIVSVCQTSAAAVS